VPSASMARPAGAGTLNQLMRLLNDAEHCFIVPWRHVQFSLVGPISYGEPGSSDHISIPRVEPEESNVHRR
jgi:hypothetical protein